MTRQAWWFALVYAGTLGLAAQAVEIPEKQRKAIDKGLEWLAKAQAADGHWAAFGDRNSTNLTARAGLVLLMEGSTTSQGKYRDQLRKAVDWLVERSQNNGLVCNVNNRFEARNYVEGHGFAMLFLASVCLQEEDAERRKKLEQVLTRAVDFCGKAQTDLGGWGFVSAKEGGGLDVGDMTATQMQGLRACQNAGIPGTGPILDKAVKYLEKCTTPRGGVMFSLAARGSTDERTNLTAAALVCSFSAGQYDSDLVKKWIAFCRFNIPANVNQNDPFGYTRYYYAQALHVLGDNGFERLFPKSRPAERLTWSKYKSNILDQLIASQGQDGNWGPGNETLLLTTVNLTLLQLNATTLPIYRRTAPKEDAPKLIKNLNDKDARVRLEAAEGLAHIGALKPIHAREGVGPLCDVARKDTDAQVRAAAASTLGELRLEPEKVVPVLCQVVKEDKDSAVQLAGINALGSFGRAARAARPILLQAEARTLEELRNRTGDAKTRQLTESKYQSIKNALNRIGAKN